MEEMRFGRLVFIPGRNGGRYPFCNSLLIDDEKKAIIDPASDEARLSSINSEMKIDAVINSHFHEDHIAFNYLFPAAELEVHEAAAPCFRSYNTFLDYSGLLPSEHRDEWDDLFLRKYHFQERSPGVEFKDGDKLSFGNTTATVIYTPGHTIGHSCLYFFDEGILFLGDIDLTRFGPWYGDGVSDIDQLIQSVYRILEIPAEIYITSHERGVIRGNIAGLCESYIEIIYRREKELLKLLEKPRALDEIVNRRIIFGKEIEPRFFFESAERGMIRKHLERLISSGRVELKEGRYYLI